MSAATSTPTDQGAAAVAIAEPAKAAPTPVVEQKGEPAKATQQQPSEAEKALAALKPAEPGQTEKSEPKKEAEKAAEPKATAPEKYEPWKLQEGVKLSPELDGTFSELARKAGMSQADAQASLDKLVEAHIAQQQSELRAQVDSWYGEVIKDPKLGGDNFQTKTMPNVMKALNAFDKSGKVAAMLQNGLGVHPDMVRMLDAIGEAVGEHSDLVTGLRNGPKSASIDDLYEATKVK